MPSVGSPPRMRGKGRTAIGYRLKGRITPACAGKRRWATHDFGDVWDHPRVCGEKYKSVSPDFFKPGSPPRVRGKAQQKTSLSPTSRITPACAGKSKSRMQKSADQRDHPRVCGEKPPQSDAHRLGGGSPPRVRGKVLLCQVLVLESGITPACAGKRTASLFCGGADRDHPRVCGEKTKKIP